MLVNSLREYFAAKLCCQDINVYSHLQEAEHVLHVYTYIPKKVEVICQHTSLLLYWLGHSVQKNEELVQDSAM